MSDVNPIQVRPSHLCPLCDCPKADGEHAVYEFDQTRMAVVICRPIIVCHYPRRLGTITNIAEPAN